MAQLGGIDAVSKQMVPVVTMASELEAMYAPLRSLPAISRQFGGLDQATFANLGPIANLGHQFDGIRDLTASWTANIAHVQNLLPSLARIGGLPMAAGTPVHEPPTVAALGPTVAQYQLEAMRDLRAEAREQRRMSEASIATTNALLAQVRTEVAAQRAEGQRQRLLLLASLGAALVLIACAVVSIFLAIHP